MEMNKELLEKYCSNSCNKEELSAVLAWFEKSAVTPEGKSLLLKIWDELPDDSSNTDVNFDSLLYKIHHEVNLRESRRLLQISDHDPVKFKRRERFYNAFMRAAAILLLPVLGFGLYFASGYLSAKHGHISVNQSYNEVFSSVDAITKVDLPDGTKVWLNHSSSLRYPAVFQGCSRNVELLGEGYFEVAHNSKIPFIVKAGDVQVKATGTTFNVMAYPDDERVETSLIEGQVELLRAVSRGNVVLLAKMKPKDFVVYQRNNKEITTRTVDDDRYFSWKSGKLVFNKEPMGEVVKELSRWFNVDIQITDPKLLELTYTATFENESLPQVMELIAMASPVSYSISNRKEISPGVFSKRKVVLSKRGN
jgi:transmembrane sensor